MSEEQQYVRLRLKVLIRTEEASLVDLGGGKVWVPEEAVRSCLRVEQGIFEMEILKSVLEAKRAEMRGLKEKATGVKGSILGDVVEVVGRLVKEEQDALRVEIDGREMFLPRVCFSEIEPLEDGRCRFVVQKNYYNFKLRRLENLSEEDQAFTTARARVLRETDRAYCLVSEGREFWFPKREVLEVNDIPGEEEKELIVPTDFWLFKLSGGSY